MKDDACISFLQWALPQLHMRWPGFRKVRGQVCKRLGRRLTELQLPDVKDYCAYLENNPLEWHILDSIFRITISRFYRDRGIYDALGSHVIPELVKAALQQGEKNLSCWCIGAASGEEPYSVSLLWELSGLERKNTGLQILATEVDRRMINRAKRACYRGSSIKELPDHMKIQAFIQKNNQFCLKDKYRKRVAFLKQDIRKEQPDDTFHLILCRNLVFTYFSPELQEEIGQKIIALLKPGGCLVLGAHEELSGSLSGMSLWLPGQKIYRKKGQYIF